MFYYYLCAAVTLISAVVSFGFSINAYLKAEEQKDNSITNAMYAMSRSCSLLLASLVPVFYVSNSYLFAVSIAMICVQLFDGVVGMRIKNTFKTFGPFSTAIGNGIVLVLLFLN